MGYLAAMDLQNSGLVEPWGEHGSRSGGLSGRIHDNAIPRAEALGHSVWPLRGNRPYAVTPSRRYAHTPSRSPGS